MALKETRGTIESGNQRPAFAYLATARTFRLPKGGGAGRNRTADNNGPLLGVWLTLAARVMRAANIHINQIDLKGRCNHFVATFSHTEGGAP